MRKKTLPETVSRTGKPPMSILCTVPIGEASCKFFQNVKALADRIEKNPISVVNEFEQVGYVEDVRFSAGELTGDRWSVRTKVPIYHWHGIQSKSSRHHETIGGGGLLSTSSERIRSRSRSHTLSLGLMGLIPLSKPTWNKPHSETQGFTGVLWFSLSGIAVYFPFYLKTILVPFSLATPGVCMVI
jgi:hypothetical protein